MTNVIRQTADREKLVHRPQLTALVETHGLRWADIARHMDGRTDQQCMGRWRRHLDPRVRREPWSTKEDRCLAELRVRHGANWSAIGKEMVDRTAQQCRARWFQAHFTGHRYIDASGKLLSKAEADAAEKAVDDAKAAAARAGKTLRPNGVKAAAGHEAVELVMKQKGIVKEAKCSKGKKKRKRGEGDAEGAEDGRKHAALARDASGRFAPKEEPAAEAAAAPPWSLRTPATTPGKTDAPPPLLPKKGARPPSSEETLLGVPRGEDATNLSNLETARALTSSLNVALPPDVAELIMKEASLPSPTEREATRKEASALPALEDPARRLRRNGSSFVLGSLSGTKELEDGGLERAGLATMNSGDWGAMLAGDLGSVAAMVETATAAMTEAVSTPGSFPTLAGGTSNMDSFKMAIARVAPAGVVSRGPAVK